VEYDRHPRAVAHRFELIRANWHEQNARHTKFPRPFNGPQEVGGKSVSETQEALPGHEDNAVEDVVATNDRYLIVAKRGAGADYVREHS
jgi:hypothetical protein